MSIAGNLRNPDCMTGITGIAGCGRMGAPMLAALRAGLPAHIAMIYAPMSAAPIAAPQARLSFMLGGDAADIVAIQPALSAIGTYFHYMGGPGMGMQAKVLNSPLAASHIVMTRMVLDGPIRREWKNRRC